MANAVNFDIVVNEFEIYSRYYIHVRINKPVKGMNPYPPGMGWTVPLMSYREHSLGGGSYPSVDKQSVYSTAPTDWPKQIQCVLLGEYQTSSK